MRFLPISPKMKAIGHELPQHDSVYYHSPPPHYCPKAAPLSLHTIGSAHPFTMAYDVCNQTPPTPAHQTWMVSYPLDGSMWTSWRPHRLHRTPGELHLKRVLPSGFHISENDTLIHNTASSSNLGQLTHPGLLPIPYSYN